MADVDAGVDGAGSSCFDDVDGAVASESAVVVMLKWYFRLKAQITSTEDKCQGTAAPTNVMDPSTSRGCLHVTCLRGGKFHLHGNVKEATPNKQKPVFVPERSTH